MKKETKECIRVFAIALAVMIAAPLAYRLCIHIWPPKEKPHRTLEQFFKDAEAERGVELLAKPVAKWSDADAKAEPEIYAWLKEQGNEILPWEWTEEARRKDPKGYAKCWRRVWEERKSRREPLAAWHRKEIKRLERELRELATIHAHRTNQIERLRHLSATNAFPCKVAVERLEKGRVWGWNKRVDVVEFKDAAEMAASTNGIRGIATAAADEAGRAKALSDSLAISKEKLEMYEKLCEICDGSNGAIEDGSLHDGALKRALVENLKDSVFEEK